MFHRFVKSPIAIIFASAVLFALAPTVRRLGRF